MVVVLGRMRRRKTLPSPMEGHLGLPTCPTAGPQGRTGLPVSPSPLPHLTSHPHLPRGGPWLTPCPFTLLTFPPVLPARDLFEETGVQFYLATLPHLGPHHLPPPQGFPLGCPRRTCPLPAPGQAPHLILGTYHHPLVLLLPTLILPDGFTSPPPPHRHTHSYRIRIIPKSGEEKVEERSGTFGIHYLTFDIYLISLKLGQTTFIWNSF